MFNDGENVHDIRSGERSLVLAVEVVLTKQNLQSHFQSKRPETFKNKSYLSRTYGKQFSRLLLDTDVLWQRPG